MARSRWIPRVRTELALVGLVVALVAPLCNAQLLPPTRRMTAEYVGGGESHIVGGSDAPEGRYPYAVTLQTEFGKHQCGGSLIAPDIVLSAAHCAYQFREVHIGRHNYKTNTMESESFGFESQIVHPLYDFTDYDHDLLIIKLQGVSTIPPVLLNRNPRFPAEGFELTALGWGRTNGTDENSLSETLQEAKLIYIDNERCKGLWGNQITDDMFCTTQDGRGVACVGDSGGPVVLRATTAEGDLQVGLTSWGPLDCASERLPSVNARITDMLDWIDSQICALSDFPPPNVDCRTTFSPAPTGSPTAPTASPAPTTSKTLVTVQIQFDAFPQESGWKIEDEDGEKVAGENPGFYLIENAPFEQELFLTIGQQYAFTVIDIAGDGMCCEDGEGFYKVWLGKPEDGRLVVTGTGDFEGVKRQKFWVEETHPANLRPTRLPKDTSGDFPVELTIVTDERPEEITWTLERLDLPQKELVINVPPNTYDQKESAILEVALVEAGGVYRLTLDDYALDGTCCEHGEGSYSLDLGGGEGVTQLIPGNFTPVYERTFAASLTGRPPSLGVDFTTLSLVIQFDGYPNEFGWIVLAEPVDTSQKAAPVMEVVAFGPRTPYDTAFANKQLVQTIAVPAVEEGTERQFQLIVHDSAGDGLCCSFGDGFYRLMYGSVDRNIVLLSGNLEGMEREITDFVLTSDGSPNAPSAEPTPTPAPVQTPFPTESPTSSGWALSSVSAQICMFAALLGLFLS